MRTYDENLKIYRDNQNAMDYAIQTAVEEARRESRIELARKMKMKNMAVDEIIEFTGLSREEIEAL